MRINEAERLAGISKVNIRFYEKEGLLVPGRISQNGYRDYSEADVLWLKRIRLLRMLDVPIGDILRLKAGELSLSDGMEEHCRRLERRRTDLAHMEELCRELRDSGCTLELLDADSLLAAMERREQEGVRFMDVKKQDRRAKLTAPFVAAAVMILLMAGLIAVLAWGVRSDPDAPGWIMLVAILPAAVIIGVLLALFQRIKQIKGGEEDAASQY